ncbi:ABC transporter substrate-binding protein [Dehalogenimonas etheniformans]|uniref:ABC transporter substrate-binding protein n=1 Tax=Dehalogenimonas etheniformans TaxID=1536648 RepID=A0A2P5P970_9CHLR|nr:ABC transporter substrate-binding protein [Dehalogenimonas etheniformans]PPD58834.1 ABC transporter substrate-binding protein [Dehalogenimonas etheniformans]QNT76396.1 ABC transporter substrate-binding protein [Dehalogenimonas etheniformans]
MKGKTWFNKACIALVTLIVAGLPILASGCGNGNGSTTPPPGSNTDAVKNPIKVGIMAPYTGAAASKGKPMGDGVLDAIKYINTELNGVQGHQIQPVFRDGQYNAPIETTIINEFISPSSGIVMFTTQASAEMTVVMGIANEAGLPGFTVFSAPNITQPAKHQFASFPDYGDDWVAFAKYYLANIWKGTGKPKMALHLLNNSTGQGAKDAADKSAASLGIEIVAVETHTSTTASEIESLTRIKAKNPDVIYISSTPPPTAVILKNAATLGITPGVTIGCGGASFTSEMVNLAGAAAEGVFGIYPTVAWGDNVPAMAKMTEYLTKNHPEDANNMDYITGWAEGLLIAEILNKAITNTPGGGNALTPALVEANGFKKLSGFDVGGLQGPATYTVGDNRFSKTVKLYQVKSGKITGIGSWIDAPYIDYGFK